MTTVTVGVSSRESASERFRRAMTAGQAQGAFRSFETDEDLWKTLTFKRWEMLKAMAGAGPLSIHEVARRVGRDATAVQEDVHALLGAGLIDETENGKIIFPFDAIHVDFMLKAA